MKKRNKQVPNLVCKICEYHKLICLIFFRHKFVYIVVVVYFLTF